MSAHKRFLVTLTPETHRILKDFSAATGTSMSSVLSGLADEAAPALQDLQKAFAMAKTKPAQAFENMAELLGQAHIDLAQVQLELVDTKRKLRRGGKQK